MDRWVKLAVASAVLCFGSGVAMMYRHQSPPPERAVSADMAGASVLRQSTGPQIPPSARPEPRPVALQTQPPPVVARPRATIRGPLDPGEPPPKLARRYPSQDDPLTLDAAPIDYRLPLPPDSKPATRIHKIVDGDTLAGLAEYYLGSANRQREIYEMNRQTLSSPAALPIGVELRIPPRSIESPPADDDPPEHTPSERPLVPVVDYTLTGEE
jgi:nucleoid-associated protein YgaU